MPHCDMEPPIPPPAPSAGRWSTIPPPPRGEIGQSIIASSFHPEYRDTWSIEQVVESSMDQSYGTNTNHVRETPASWRRSLSSFGQHRTSEFNLHLHSGYTCATTSDPAFGTFPSLPSRVTSFCLPAAARAGSRKKRIHYLPYYKTLDRNSTRDSVQKGCLSLVPFPPVDSLSCKLSASWKCLVYAINYSRVQGSSFECCLVVSLSDSR